MASIYSEIGGREAVSAAVDLFYSKLLADSDLADYFGEVDLPRLKAHQRAFLSSALGGPDSYGGRPIGSAHIGLGITEADFDAVVGHLADTLVELGVAGETIDSIASTLAPLKSEVVEPHATSAP